MREMDYSEYQNNAVRTKSPLSPRELSSKDLDNLHMIMGMSTEVGELMDAFKKELAYGKELDLVNVEEEIGDLMWYVANFCVINNLSFGKILSRNTAKLYGRYPEKFTSENAINRDLDKERIILENGCENHKNVL